MMEETKIYDVSKFDSEIQLHYINNYTSFDPVTSHIDSNNKLLPNTRIVQEIYNNWKKCYKLTSDEDFENYIVNDNDFPLDREMTGQKFSVNSDNIFDASNYDVEIIGDKLHYGNVEMSQVFDSFKNNNFTNSFKYLDGIAEISEPFSIIKLNIVKFTAYILYKQSTSIGNKLINKFIEDDLKTQINKDVLRQHIYINEELINDKFIKNDPYLPDNYHVNIFNLNLLESIDRISPSSNDGYKYNLMNMIGILMIQFVFEFFNEVLSKKILSSLQIKTHEEVSVNVNISPPMNDDNYTNGSDNKYNKIYIDNENQKVITVSYNRISFQSFDDESMTVHLLGYIYFVLEYDIVKNTVSMKYVSVEYDYKKHNEKIDEILNTIQLRKQQDENRLRIRQENLLRQQQENSLQEQPTKFQQIKETIGDNKTATTAGTLLALGALSAIPLALLLGGKHTSKRMRGGLCRKCTRRIKNKKNKNKYRRTFNKKTSKRQAFKRRISKRKVFEK
jgi:hypothetical protein